MPFFPWSTRVPSMAVNHMSFFGIVLKNNILKEKSGQTQPQANLLKVYFFFLDKFILFLFIFGCVGSLLLCAGFL